MNRLFFRLSLVLLLSLPSFLLAQAGYADHSVLASGNWYKIAVLKDGVHKLDYSFFSNLGLTGVDPRNIRIYGNGGGMVPQANDVPRHDDLVENPIFVSGENDGSFDGGDYVLFYAESSHSWELNESNNRYHHQHNLYADTNFYFLNVDLGTGKRIETRAEESNSTYTLSNTRNYDYHEVEKSNLIRSGRYWAGEKFDLITEREIALYTPGMKTDGNTQLSLRLLARSDVSTSFSIYSGSELVSTENLSAVSINSSQAPYFSYIIRTFNLNQFNLQGDSLKIRLVYNKNGSTNSEGWIDWAEINYEQNLDAGNRNQYAFSVEEGTGTGEVAELTINNANASYQLWDVTNPVEPVLQAFTVNGNSIQTAFEASNPKRMILAKAGYNSPVGVRKIANQDLHSLPLADYLIIAYSQFMDEAEQLADFHRSHYGRTVHVVSVRTIYNEFSSGRLDVSAIRDFIKMFYDRSGGEKPGFVLFFGDGVFDYKNLLNSPEENNFVPTYQSRNSVSPTTSYTSDDFFGFLDDDEGYWGEGSGLEGDLSVQTNYLDVAIGRLPVANNEEALAMVEKVKKYVTGIEGFGDWRNTVLLVADHKEGEGSLHVSQADGYTSHINETNPCFNIEKIYMDNYPMVNTAVGTRFPEGRNALLNKLDEGSLIVNYTGHGGESTWSNSRILELPDIRAMKNTNRLPAYITATCEFGRFDDPDRRSGAEWLVINDSTGAIAMFTTVRLVFSGPNQRLNENFYEEILDFDEDLGRMPTIGEAMQRTKNATFPISSTTDINSRNFTLIGDPGIILNYPQLKAEITHINGQAVSSATDTLKSLQKVSIAGVIQDGLGNPRPDFSGDLEVIVFDKPNLFTTNLSSFPFYWQKNRVFNGSAIIENGEFNIEFVVPIDISYEEGFGKISLYFTDGLQDGAGCRSNLYIGGTANNANPDEDGPNVQLFIGDNRWRDGGTTNENPLLYAEIGDESGINTVGSGIGHEITAILDNDESQVFILNDFYTAKQNDFTQGTISYQLRELEEGEHTIKIRVWDVANNSSEDETSFIVVTSEQMAIAEVLSYPNPFQDEATFSIQHNQSGKQLEATVEIFDTYGRKIKTLQSNFLATGNVNEDLKWNGQNENGGEARKGMYIYRVTLKDVDTGQIVTKGSRMIYIK